MSRKRAPDTPPVSHSNRSTRPTNRTTRTTRLQLPFAMATALLATGCPQEKCLENGYVTTVDVIQDYNHGRCQTLFNGDQRSFDCPSGQLVGEVNGRIFDLTLEAPTLHLTLTNATLSGQCATTEFTSQDPDLIATAQSHFKTLLREMEVD